MSKILEINNLSVQFSSERGTTLALDGITLHLNRGETLGIVGESGSGKSVTALSVMGLLPTPAGKVLGGEIVYWPSVNATLKGENKLNLLALPYPAMQRIRGAEIAMIFQEPMTSLNPVFRCGHQVAEAIQLHQKISSEEAKVQTIKLLERVKLSDPLHIFQAYPHQISGGEKQRVMIAMALSCQPSILIADEPTTALDVTVQKTILDLLRELRNETGLSMLFVSHDLGVISEICDRVVVMCEGKIVEEGWVKQVLRDPQHPYTRGLVACRPSLQHKLHQMPTVSSFGENKTFEAQIVTPQETAARRETLYQQRPILTVKDLQVRYPKRKNWLGQPAEWFHAVDNVSFEVYPGETFGLAGESGCGKTTLGRTIARLQPAHSGEVWYDSSSTLAPRPSPLNLLALREDEMRPLRRDIQVIFQDPKGSLNPRMTLGAAIAEPMRLYRLHDSERQCREKTIELLETVGLQADHAQRYPQEFSGGQRQRICIARALAVQPKLLICDECVSALDVSVQATVLNLLMELQHKLGLTYLFISHDLSVIKQMCDRLLVMNKGKTEALGFPEDIYDNPQQEYVQRLMEAIPGTKSSNL